jgi:hypothetical protein
MKKNILYFIICVFCAGATLALTSFDLQTSNIDEEITVVDPEVKWDALQDAYHEVMAGTFHPAQDGNLQPLRERSKELKKAAKKWSKAKLPSKHAGKGLAMKLDALAKESAAINKLVKSKVGDKELTDAIYGLHGIFHDVVGMCSDNH